MTHADNFDAAVKRIHRIPSISDTTTWSNFCAVDITMSYRFGAWKITQVDFADGSYYNVGQPDQGAHT